MPKHNHITVTDLFCGAGGSSTGAAKAGGEIFVALNHWELAVQTHNANFPNALHETCDVSACNPRRYPSTRVLIASPECTNHSLAKGKKRKHQKQGNLFELKIDPSEERSRVTMMDVPRFAEYHNYDLVITENVCDVRYWAGWDSWLLYMKNLGYEHKVIYFNSMFCWPVPQSRDRIYVVFWKRGVRAPNLEFNPPAWCEQCEKIVPTIQSWKNPNRQFGKYGPLRQYTYNCPHCNRVCHPYYFAAANAIDFSIPSKKIGDRKKPLAEKTIERIKMGLRKFGFNRHCHVVNSGRQGIFGLDNPIPTQTGTNRFALFDPFVFKLCHPDAGRDRSKSLQSPLPTQTGRQDIGLVSPPLLMTNHIDCSIRELEEPFTTVVAGGNHHFGINLPLIGINNSNVCLRGADGPLHTATGSNHQFILDYKDNPLRSSTEPLSTVEASAFHHYLLSYYSGGGQVHAVGDPMPTISTKDRHSIVSHFLSKQYSSDHHHAHSLFEPTGTITTQDHHALVGSDVDINECTFRMLKVPEIRRAMAFADDYQLFGSADNQVKLLGNAVNPPVMKMLIERCIEVL